MRLALTALCVALLAQSALAQVVTAPANTGVIIATGAVPSNSGACAINTQLGGNAFGSFKANGICTASTVILTFAITAPNGWSCQASDLTTTADSMKQTAYTQTTATFTGTMASADLVTFMCIAF